jgi:hypothetical protein
MNQGSELIQALLVHILESMQYLPECRPGGTGEPNRRIEEMAGLNLELTEHNGWLTWSLLQRLEQDGKIEVLRAGRRYTRLFRLASSPSS